MRVEDATRIGQQGLWSDLLHVAGQQDELHARLAQRRQNRGVQIARIRMCRCTEVDSFDRRCAGPCQGPRIAVVADDYRDLGIELATDTGVQDRLKCSALARGQDSDPKTASRSHRTPNVRVLSYLHESRGEIDPKQ